MSATFSMPSEHSAFYRKVPLKIDKLDSVRRSPESIFLAIFDGVGDSEDGKTPTPGSPVCILEEPIHSDPCTETEEEEEIPAWIRYMPRTHSQGYSTSSTANGSGHVSSHLDLDLSEQLPHSARNVKQRPSSNPFGSTSLKATSVSRQQREKRLNENGPYKYIQSRERIKDIKDKLSRCNVGEASMLLSMSSIDKNKNESQSSSSVPHY